MPHPKKKHTKAAKGQRRSHHAISETDLTSCPKCKEKILPHRVCQKCGTYNSRQAIEIKDEKDEKKKAAKKARENEKGKEAEKEEKKKK
jgi:large subunit ribosomal protein L32